MTVAKILRSDHAEWVRCFTPFNANFVTELKETIPPAHRKWIPEGKYWLVQEAYLRTLKSILKKYYKQVDVEEVPIQPISTCDVASEVLRMCPEANRKNLFRALSLAFHPDVGGSNEVMKSINLTWEELTSGNFSR